MSVEFVDVSLSYRSAAAGRGLGHRSAPDAGTGAPATAAGNGLEHVSFRADDGGFLGIMGRTGSGKSTLLRLAAGLLAPDEGRVLVDGRDINARAGRGRRWLRREMGFVFQFPENQLFETTVFKEVAFGMRHLGFPRDEIGANARRAIELMGFDFDAVKNVSPLGLSGGQKRRVAIAAALASKPKTLLLDEPIAGLDPAGREKFLELLGRLNDAGTTILMVSHNSDAVCDAERRTLVLDGGRVCCDGPTAEVFADEGTLARHGIRPSQAGRIAALLRARGYDVPRETVTRGAIFDVLKDIRAGRLAPAAGGAGSKEAR
ncbi:MAG: ATP-binding cassette domain-containing protein [Aeriscardovia sp.]|nr:ATP-binding cassette domain-containing protein [Aeriscardovia sp.]